ncbi:hypothetical protein CBR_g28676 [Chara braunii]|uniref:Uncharacterized protein n=1 Tax=Chara braunii TaxID=69332 RepID=A0A388L9Q7_CHABU|nr:hypothetical protein CBR_g28676 [Chara braunii]|eukprot:GBG78962.1 hypothetical protein CBR_g28676 [Chara braunii]
MAIAIGIRSLVQVIVMAGTGTTEEGGESQVEDGERETRTREERTGFEGGRGEVSKEKTTEEEGGEERLEAEDREAMRKDLRMEIRMHMGNVCEELHQRLASAIPTKKKDKGKLPVHVSSEEKSDEPEGSDVEAVCEQTEELAVKEKRKRSVERPVGDSPPIKTHAKRASARDVLDPKRLLLSCRRQLLKRSPRKQTPKSLRSARKGKKVPASPGTMGRLMFVTDNLRELGDRNIEDLKQICRSEDVPYEGKPVCRRSKMKSRRGKRERAKCDAEARRVPPKESNRLQTVLPVKTKVLDEDDWSVDFYRLILKQDGAAAQRFNFTVESGNAWCGGWKSVTRAFESSIVRWGRQRKRLSMCKLDFERGGIFEMVMLVKWVSKASPDKRFLISLFRNPCRLEVLKACSPEVLLRLSKAAGDFHKAFSAAYLRRFVVRAIKEVYGWKLIIRLKYDDRIRLVEVRKLVNDKIEALTILSCLKDAARGMIQIVWVKNPSIVEMIHNQRRFARAEVSTCVCAGLPYPRVGGHVQFRLQELEWINPRICHALNVPKLCVSSRTKPLGREIAAGFVDWRNWTGPDVSCRDSELSNCMSGSTGEREKFLNPLEVEKVKSVLGGLVLTPVDRNPGKTLVMCPASYYEAMMGMFVTTAGYTIVKESEAEVHQIMRSRGKELDLQKFVRWDGKETGPQRIGWIV